MSFIRLNRELREQQKIMLDTVFVLEDMPFAPENYVKVYLLGLTLAEREDTEPEQIELTLNLDRKTVIDAFLYWQSKELVNVVLSPELKIEYLPVLPLIKRVPKFDKNKYKSFNDQLHVLVKDRVISPNEYNEYYSFMERSGMDADAFLIVIGYCLRIKGGNIGYRYILAVAKDIAKDGLLTYEHVREKLDEFDLYDPELKAVFKALKLSARRADPADKRLFIKWKKEFGFSQETVLAVAKNVKVTTGQIQVLDTLLCRYYESRLSTIAEIEAFEKNRDAMYALAKGIVKTLALRYNSFDQIIETYLSPWLSSGFSEEALLIIASYLFKSNSSEAGRSLGAMNELVKKYYSKGLITAEAIKGFYSESAEEDDKIKLRLGLTRPLTEYDRDCYKTWTDEWKLDGELIDYARTLAKGGDNEMRYMNRILLSWKEKGYKTAAEAKKYAAETQNNAGGGKSGSSVVMREGDPNFVSRSLTAEELNAMIERLSDDDL
jgi:DnaD/phage-associated family protein